MSNRFGQPARALRVAVVWGTALGLLSACAGAKARESRSAALDSRAQVVRTALAQIGTPYRFGGASPRGFDCSGLVLYSYQSAGLNGLPHSAAGLERVAARVPLADLAPGDLLFFKLSGYKTSHVGIYLGGREFVHAPSGGRAVERVSFDHPYWGNRLERAGRLLR